MSLSDRDIQVIKFIALLVEMERASNHRFIFDRQFIEFISHLTDEEKQIVTLFHDEREKTDIIGMSLEQWLNNHL
jgi:hypothetical protein